MRTVLTTVIIGLVAAVLANPRASSQDAPQWQDLFGNDLRDWSRLEGGKSPWRMTTAGSLICADANDTMISERLFTDGTIKLEFRFRPTEQKTGYKGAIWARRTQQGTGCRISLGDACGTLAATYQAGSDRIKNHDSTPKENPARPIGEWNEVVLELKGTTVAVTINGKPAATFEQCDTDKGLFALEAESSEIEFRNVHWKEGK